LHRKCQSIFFGPNQLSTVNLLLAHPVDVPQNLMLIKTPILQNN